MDVPYYQHLPAWRDSTVVLSRYCYLSPLTSAARYYGAGFAYLRLKRRLSCWHLCASRRQRGSYSAAVSLSSGLERRYSLGISYVDPKKVGTVTTTLKSDRGKKKRQISDDTIYVDMEKVRYITVPYLAAWKRWYDAVPFISISKMWYCRYHLF